MNDLETQFSKFSPLRGAGSNSEGGTLLTFQILEKIPPLLAETPISKGGVFFQRGGIFSKISPDVDVNEMSVRRAFARRVGAGWTPKGTGRREGAQRGGGAGQAPKSYNSGSYVKSVF